MSDVIEKLFLYKQKGILDGSWLITGEETEDKSIIIQHFINRLFKKEDDFTGYLPSVKWIKKPLTDTSKNDFAKAISKAKITDKVVDSLKYKSEIPVESIRDISRFVSTTTDSETYRILVIDRADDLNEKAQNALLKMLEEPPSKTLFFLLCDNRAKLLPTIISRCRILRLHPSSLEDLEAALKESIPENIQPLLMKMGDYKKSEIEKIYTQGGLDFYGEILEILENKTPLEKILSLTEKAAKDDDSFSIFCTVLMYTFLEKSKEDLSYIEKMNTFTQKIAQTKALYLDKGQMLFNILVDFIN